MTKALLVVSVVIGFLYGASTGFTLLALALFAGLAPKPRFDLAAGIAQGTCLATAAVIVAFQTYRLIAWGWKLLLLGAIVAVVFYLWRARSK